MRPLRDNNGNLPMRFKSTEEQRRIRSKTLATHAGVENNYSKCASVASELPSSIAARLLPVHDGGLPRILFHDRAEVEKVFPTDADDGASSSCGDEGALDFRVRHGDARRRHRRPFTSGFDTSRIPETVVVKVEPTEMSMNDMWRPW